MTADPSALQFDSQELRHFNLSNSRSSRSRDLGSPPHVPPPGEVSLLPEVAMHQSGPSAPRAMQRSLSDQVQFVNMAGIAKPFRTPSELQPHSTWLSILQSAIERVSKGSRWALRDPVGRSASAMLVLLAMWRGLDCFCTWYSPHPCHREVSRFLHSIHLSQYETSLCSKGYTLLLDILHITDENLRDDVGIAVHAHRRRILVMAAAAARRIALANALGWLLLLLAVCAAIAAVYAVLVNPTLRERTFVFFAVIASEAWYLWVRASAPAGANNKHPLAADAVVRAAPTGSSTYGSVHRASGGAAVEGGLDEPHAQNVRESCGESDDCPSLHAGSGRIAPQQLPPASPGRQKATKWRAVTLRRIARRGRQRSQEWSQPPIHAALHADSGRPLHGSPHLARQHSAAGTSTRSPPARALLRSFSDSAIVATSSPSAPSPSLSVPCSTPEAPWSPLSPGASASPPSQLPSSASPLPTLSPVLSPSGRGPARHIRRASKAATVDLNSVLEDEELDVRSSRGSGKSPAWSDCRSQLVEGRDESEDEKPKPPPHRLVLLAQYARGRCKRLLTA